MCFSFLLCQYGMRPVLWAAWFGHLDVLRLLVNAGACKYSTNKVRTPGPQTAPIALKAFNRAQTHLQKQILSVYIARTDSKYYKRS